MKLKKRLLKRQNIILIDDTIISLEELKQIVTLLNVILWGMKNWKQIKTRLFPGRIFSDIFQTSTVFFGV